MWFSLLAQLIFLFYSFLCVHIPIFLWWLSSIVQVHYNTAAPTCLTISGAAKETCSHTRSSTLDDRLAPIFSVVRLTSSAMHAISRRAASVKCRSIPSVASSIWRRRGNYLRWGSIKIEAGMCHKAPLYDTQYCIYTHLTVQIEPCYTVAIITNFRFFAFSGKFPPRGDLPASLLCFRYVTYQQHMIYEKRYWNVLGPFWVNRHPQNCLITRS